LAIKKSEHYSFLWASCDELSGGMDADRYKDDVLVPPFSQYAGDKYVDVPYVPVPISECADTSVNDPTRDSAALPTGRIRLI
jgi:type I restriction enzyme M protein